MTAQQPPIPPVCRCGDVAPIRCPLHGDEAQTRTSDAFREVADLLGARPGGPLRVVEPPTDSAQQGTDTGGPQ